MESWVEDFTEDDISRIENTWQPTGTYYVAPEDRVELEGEDTIR